MELLELQEVYGNVSKIVLSCILSFNWRWSGLVKDKRWFYVLFQDFLFLERSVETRLMAEGRAG